MDSVKDGKLSKEQAQTILKRAEIFGDNESSGASGQRKAALLYCWL